VGSHVLEKVNNRNLRSRQRLESPRNLRSCQRLESPESPRSRVHRQESSLMPQVQVVPRPLAQGMDLQLRAERAPALEGKLVFRSGDRV